MSGVVTQTFLPLDYGHGVTMFQTQAVFTDLVVVSPVVTQELLSIRVFTDPVDLQDLFVLSLVLAVAGSVHPNLTSALIATAVAAMILSSTSVLLSGVDVED